MKIRYGRFVIMLALAAVISGFLSPAPANSGVEAPKIINKAVVKIFSISNQPNQYVPWQFKPQKRGIGSGVIIDRGRILTNAHVVANSIFLQVKKSGNPKKYQARVLAVGHECDLALITVDDESFFEGTETLELGGLPDPQSEVSVFGYPKGGNEISITKGIVSRIEQMGYTHGDFHLLGVQIDAAINPGNSGGPVLMGDMVVGVAMQALVQGENIGYLIPTPVINHFLEDVKDGVYDGFPDDGLLVQGMENEALRKYYGMTEDDTGVLVGNVIYGSSAHGHILPGDVILSVDGVSVANDNTIPLKDDLRVSVDYLVRKHYLGEELSLEIIRDKKRMSVSFLLDKQKRLFELTYDKKPSYYVYGGLIFVPLTKSYMKEWGRNWERNAPAPLLAAAENAFPSEERDQIVFISNTLAHPMNSGYHGIYFKIVETVNGQRVKNMKALASILDNPEGKYTVIEFSDGMRAILDNEKAAASEEEILSRSGVPHRASPDLRAPAQ